LDLDFLRLFFLGPGDDDPQYAVRHPRLDLVIRGRDRQADSAGKPAETAFVAVPARTVGNLGRLAFARKRQDVVLNRNLNVARFDAGKFSGDGNGLRALPDIHRRERRAGRRPETAVEIAHHGAHQRKGIAAAQICRVEHYWPPVADRCPRTVGMEGPGNGAGRMWVRRPPIKIGGSIYYASIYDACIALWMECGLSCVSCNRRKDTYDLFGHRADRDDDPPGRAAHPAA